MASELPLPRPAFARWMSSGNTITQQFLAIGGRSDFISLAGGLPAAEFYPTDAIAEAAAAALAQ